MFLFTLIKSYDIIIYDRAGGVAVGVVVFEN